MARMLDPESHAQKRVVFLEATERLLRTKGFEQTSVQDVLAATGASKGAFYHYFASKQELLEALAERLADSISSDLQKADAPGLTAPERLNRLFAALAATKMQQRDVIVAMLQVWFSDANAAVRQRVRRNVTVRLAAFLSDIVSQGNQEKTFTAEPSVVPIIAGLIQDHNDEVGYRILQSESDKEAIEDLMTDIRSIVAAYTSAIERVLGVAPHTIRLVDPDALDRWFGRDSVQSG